MKKVALNTVQTFAFISLAEKPGSGEAGSHGRCDVYIF